jgi:Glycosyl hydrolase family 9
VFDKVIRHAGALQVFRNDKPSSLLHTLPSGQMLLARTAAPTPDANVMGPRPLPLAMRAMAYTAAYASNRVEKPSVANRCNLRAACVSYQQLRLTLGYNGAARSYVVGVAAPGAAWPQRPRVRAASCDGNCGNKALAAPTPNPTRADGALVNGPGLDGVYEDDRADIERSGAGILNSSPLVLLAAAHVRMGLTPQDCLGMGEGVV